MPREVFHGTCVLEREKIGGVDEGRSGFGVVGGLRVVIGEMAYL